MTSLEYYLEELKKILQPEQVEEIKNTAEEHLGIYHHGLGRYLRNRWELWTDGQLKKYFNDLGIFHPDDMSAIIIYAFRRYLNKEDIYLEEQVNYYKEYWNK